MNIVLIIITALIFYNGVVAIMFSYAFYKIEKSYYAVVPLITGVVLLGLTYWLVGVIVNGY